MTAIFISPVDIAEMNYFCCCQYQQIAPSGFWIPCFRVALLRQLPLRLFIVCTFEPSLPLLAVLIKELMLDANGKL